MLFDFTQAAAFGDGNGLEIAFAMARRDFASRLFHRLFNPAVAVTVAPGVAGVIEHINFFRSGLQAMLDDPAHQSGIRIGGAFRRRIPADVGFDDDGLALFHEASHSAQRFDAAIKQRVRFAIFNCDQVRHRRSGFSSGQPVGATA